MYDAAYFQSLRDGMRRSASAAVPLLIECFQPNSVVDVGCGEGIWLSIFQKLGVTDILGIDGAWVSEDQREIPATSFREHDLTQPLKLDRTFDIALCLEVAEHLPPSAGPVLVETLTRLAPVIVFSAAIPFQVGRGHINEQLPSYWVKLFAARGYECSNGLRARLWANDAVEIWYRQNILYFTVRGHRVRAACADIGLMDVVHPDLYGRVSENLSTTMQYAKRLEVELQTHCGELETCRGELASIKNSRVWRLYKRLRAVLAVRKRAIDEKSD
jgi:SAM-dependent methyltransferase